MRPDDIAALAAEMAKAGIAQLELTGPDFTLALARGAAPATAAPQVEPQVETEAETELLPVTAPSLGAFLRKHPLHEKPLASDGETVIAGQTIALLQVGTLLTPVPAPADGMVVAAIPAEGTLVGYGDRLFDFLPQD